MKGGEKTWTGTLSVSWNKASMIYIVYCSIQILDWEKALANPTRIIYT